MLASTNARNYGAYARTRAAVLCFGGWGLQAMLHLWPRLRLIQEERAVLGRERELPNLDRLTAFAAILPETTGGAGSPPAAPVCVVQPNPERYPAPPYLERQLASIAAEPAQMEAPGLTHAERIGARLLLRARADDYVRPLPLTGLPRAEHGLDAWPTTRGDVFQAGMAAAGPIARTLLSQVVDPTRLDSMQTRDPFVQTTIYVIAPLGEPRASALIWPVTAELVEAFGRRHVSRVIAFFSTASFAPGDGRAIEEATTHMALRELEALTGSAGQPASWPGRQDGPGDDRPDFVARLLADCGGVIWEERVGRRLFDAVYLVDREKSNQALAENALDLAALVGNTVEAFLTADGWGHIERSLGPETLAGRPSYNVVGAASDHVPLAAYIAAAIEEEQKEIIRAAVLAAGEQPSRPEPDLRTLGATPEAMTRCFLDADGAPLFEPASDRPAPAWPPAVRIAPGQLQTQTDDRREARDPLRWLELLKRRTAGIAADIEGAAQAAQTAWGLTKSAGSDDVARDASAAGEAGPRAHIGVIARAADLAAEQIVADMCRAPDGILRARARLASWLDAVGTLLRDLEPAIRAAEDDDAYQADLHAWQSAFARAVASYPQTATRWARILVAACLAALGLAGILLLQHAVELGREGRVALALGLGVGLGALGAAAWRATLGRLRQLQRQRVALAQEALSRLATRLLQRGLHRAYTQLAGELAGLQAAVEEALAELTGWAHAGPAAAQPAVGAGDAATRAALAHETLWTSVRDHIHREGADAGHGLERFRALWRQEGDDAPPWAPEGNRLAWRLRTALDAWRAATDDAPSLAGVFREYAGRATEFLCPTHRLLADHPDLTREAIEQHSAERLLVSTGGQEGAGAADHNSADVVERLYVRAKPAAGFEVAYLLSSDILEIEFGVCADAPTSPLRRVFEQRGLSLLSSHDPLALTLIRTVNRLSPAELILTERCRDEFMRLSPVERARLSLFPAAAMRAAAALYGEADAPADLERRTSLAAVRG